jgi:Fe-S cluster assembly iron-binding protein IscA
MEIDRNAIVLPTLNFSEGALLQLRLMLENDFTIGDKHFRIQITGKECDGFTYSSGFTELHEDDFILEISDIKVIIDPFSAHYMKNTNIDYHQDFAVDAEGFVITVSDQKNFTGKFWREDPDKILPLKDKSLT